jgi:hypothetical protein
VLSPIAADAPEVWQERTCAHLVTRFSKTAESFAAAIRRP